MARPRHCPGWRYDTDREAFTTPSGRVITLHELVQRLVDDVEGRVDLRGDWAGRRIRAGRLKGPGDVTHTPPTARQFWN